MAVVCEPLKDKVMLKARIEEFDPKRILLIFWHGIGDLVMFINVFEAIRKAWPEKHFTIGLPRGLTHEELLKGLYDYTLVTGEEVNDTAEKLPFDLVAKITFPMNEGQTELTKGEWCCLHEIGIEPVAGHGRISPGVNRFCGVHFCITCLPGSCNPDEETAKKIWDEILAAGWIPFETHFEHIFHNPINTKFSFITATARGARAQASSLSGLIRGLGAFVGVVSGNFHVAMASLPPERVMLLEKDFKKECFTKLPIATANLKDYKDGTIKAFLEALDG